MKTFLSILLIISITKANSKGLDHQVEIIHKKTKLKKNIVKAVINGKIYAKSDVSDSKDKKGEKIQELKFKILGYHSNKCKGVLKKLTIYEDYPKHLDFVQEASYDDKNKRVKFLLASGILPMEMLLDFKLPRIKSPGIYPFSFDKGFLKGLVGTISVDEVKNRCLFLTTAYWKGKHSKFPNFVFEFFSSTLSKLAMQNLFRITKTL